MEKSMVLVLPDRAGKLREVLRIFSENQVALLRISYNRVVDIHTLFVDVRGTSAALSRAEEELRAWRFMLGQRSTGEICLLEVRTNNDLSVLHTALDLINRNELNITYVDARVDDMHTEVAQIGVFAKKRARLSTLLKDLKAVCDVRVVPSAEHPPMLDNNHFSVSYARRLAQLLDLGLEDEETILINSNRIMQNLSRAEEDPFRPFTSIYQIGETTAAYRGEAFAKECRVTRLKTAAGLSCVCIEPPIGSDTWVFECSECLLCVDAGYRCYADELLGVLRGLYPDWDQQKKELVLTHGDIDHVGDCSLFDKVYASGRTIDGFMFESMGIVNWREQNPISLPYMRIGMVISGYRTPLFGDMVCLGEASPLGEQQELFRHIDTLNVDPLSFEVWEGKGGHVRGEIILIERTHMVCLSGDVFVNVHGETKPQARYNSLAPYLMTSVDSIPALAREERAEMFAMLGTGSWQIMGGHGAVLRWAG